MPTIPIKNLVLNPSLLTENASKEQNVVADDKGPADFETAISATGFGKYNFFLILIGIPCGWSSIFETTTMSYVFPAAQCDLELSLSDKGLLNASTYLGMISSAMIWGFLFDTLGRKKLLMIGFFLDALFVVMSSTSQTKTLLMVSKFLGGFIINGPFAAFISYMSEFQSSTNRARMQMVMGWVFALGTIVIPLLAWLILPQDLNFEFKSLKFHSWNVYLLICAIPSLTATIIFLFMPESPKFLMTIGNNEKALEVFRTVYSINTGKSKESFPITELVDEIKLKQEEIRRLSQCHGGQVTANRTKLQALKEGWQQVQPMFFSPHLKNLVLVCLVETLLTMSLNTLRLWLPQIFQAINDYTYYNNDSASLCTMMDMIQPQNVTAECVVNTDNAFVYINSIIVSTVQLVTYVLAGFVINKLGKKVMTCGLAFFSGLCACAIYFSSSTIYTLAFSSLFITAASISTNVIIAIIIDLFPTTLRTMAVSLAMMFARTGAMSGNLLFPILLQSGCAPPFFSIGSLLILSAGITLLLPNTDLKALQ